MNKKQHDILLGLLGYLGKGFQFPTDPCILHECFYALKQNKKYSRLLKDISFFVPSPWEYHESCELLQFFSNLTAARLIYTFGTDLHHYHVPSDLADYIEQNGSSILKGHEKDVREASRFLKKLLNKKKSFSTERNL
jgi:hypothetical protein